MGSSGMSSLQGTAKADPLEFHRRVALLVPDGHNVPNVGIQGPQYRQQCPGDSSQGKQEIYAGHLGTGHVPGRTIRSPITTFPPFDPPLAEEVDGPTRAPDTGGKVFLSGNPGRAGGDSAGPWHLWAISHGR